MIRSGNSRFSGYSPFKSLSSVVSHISHASEAAKFVSYWLPRSGFIHTQMMPRIASTVGTASYCPEIIRHWTENWARKQQFPPLAQLGAQKEIIDPIFARILASLDIPYLDPQTKEVKRVGFFTTLEELVHSQDPSAKVYLGGGSIRNLFGFLYAELIYAKNNTSESPEEILQKMAQGTYKFRDGQTESLSKLIVLGVGSDIEILIQFSDSFLQQASASSQSEQVIHSVRSFINAFGNTLPDSPIKNALVPYADVKEYQKQTSRAMRQGGSPLDWLAFPVSPKSGIGIISPPGHPNLVNQILEGTLPFLPKTNAENVDVTTLRVIRSLLEVPCLSLSYSDEKAWMHRLRKIQTTESAYPTEITKVFSEAMGNIRFVQASNQWVRAKKGPFALVCQIGQKNCKFPLIPELLDEDNIETREEEFDPGHLREIGALLSRTQFIENFTDNGLLYHGTPNMWNFFPIIRGAYFVSSELQGTAFMGRGFYTTSSINLAQSYAQAAHPIPLRPIESSKLRILNLRHFQSYHLSKYHKLVKEARRKKIDFHQYLANEYKIDIIINEHVLIQNAKAIQRPRTIEKFFLSEEQTLLKQAESIDSIDQCTSVLNKFREHLELANGYAHSVNPKIVESLENKLRKFEPDDKIFFAAISLIKQQRYKQSPISEMALEILRRSIDIFNEKLCNYSQNRVFVGFWDFMKSLSKENSIMAAKLCETIRIPFLYTFPDQDTEFTLYFFRNVVTLIREELQHKFFYYISYGNISRETLHDILNEFSISNRMWKTILEFAILNEHSYSIGETKLKVEPLIIHLLNKYPEKTLTIEDKESLFKHAISRLRLPTAGILINRWSLPLAAQQKLSQAYLQLEPSL
ncbi:MAG TPA: hypothetical protein VLE96_02880 [Chlamydiales bacterium]|nr:hypothetical protein [Chlamydiales bacterium]